MENLEVDKTNEENQIIEPKTQNVTKPFMSKVSCQETLEQIEMKILIFKLSIEMFLQVLSTSYLNLLLFFAGEMLT